MKLFLKSSLLIACLCFSMVATSNVNGQQLFDIFTYNFEGTPNTAATPDPGNFGDLTASAYSFANGGFPPNATNSGIDVIPGTSNNAAFMTARWSGDTTVPTNTFHSFSINPTANVSGLASIDSITFDHFLSTPTVAQNYSVEVQAQVGGGGFTTLGTSTLDSTTITSTFSLSGGALSTLQDVDNQSIDFRLYFLDDVGQDDAIQFIDDIRIVASVPEPGSAAILLAFGAFAAIRRRRK